jgi:small subunit ribosomal protein S14
MAKKAMIERNKKRERMVAQYAAKRAELKSILADPNTSDEDFYIAQRKLTKLPKNSNPIRLRNRCSVRRVRFPA